ncbi:hypothetical protein BO83DRAFT_404045 [Aspergillus eucalypticola CBS 122712]|uniref:Uncharacterized protein n=1 Tax=Aspergillus eucalypticola (strain CBS 122712 / IBT 29274) TaxID=1448314 RepID=A0A317ULA0_ASPEC|nr:uncharacterized protein BO83DRAFT_404045 [Aspergillus eucalypticola CBS 122712]PWY62245.1 hypothetical protein BO83DRAFT_404045 [Aspergillus eucalypticola CBS 122712]
MKFVSLFAFTTAIGMVTAARVPLGDRQFIDSLLISQAANWSVEGEDCRVHTGEYCCTWEGCRSCCWWEKCDLSIDAAQGKCVPNW